MPVASEEKTLHCHLNQNTHVAMFCVLSSCNQVTWEAKSLPQRSLVIYHEKHNYNRIQDIGVCLTRMFYPF